MRVTSNGQVTIPIDIRKKAGLLPGTEVEFVISNKKVVIRKKGSVHHRGKALIEMMRGKGRVKMTADEIMALTRSDK